MIFFFTPGERETIELCIFIQYFVLILYMYMPVGCFSISYNALSLVSFCVCFETFSFYF